MKILYILHSSGEKEGSSIAAISFIKQLHSHGYQVCVVCPREGGIVESFRNMGVETSIIRCDMVMYPKTFTFKSCLSWPKRFMETLWHNHMAERKVTKLVKKFNPDVIHTNVGVIRVGYYVAKKMHLPHVWHIRECYNTYPSNAYQKLLLRKNKFNITITDEVRKFYSLNDTNTRTVYDGVFHEDIHPLKGRKSNYFLFVGRIIPLKGPEWAIEAFVKIADRYPDVELWMVGTDNSPLATALKEKVKNSRYASRIKFLGQRIDIYELMAHAQAFLMTSSLEGFGFTTVEAMCNRTIVIGRNLAGTKEQFDNGLRLTGKEIGLRCETVDDMAQHMAKVCSNGQKYYEDMIDTAEKVVRQMYTVEKNVRLIMKIYNKITNND